MYSTDFSTERHRSSSTTRRTGMTLIELMIVVVIMGTLMAMMVPPAGKVMTETRVQRAASVIAGDLELAFSLSARQRRPVRIIVDNAALELRLTNRAQDTTWSRRVLGSTSEFQLASLSGSSGLVEVFPSGLAASALTVTAGTGSYSRRITMTRAGQVRVTP